MEGKITKDSYRVIDHGKGCIEIEDRGFSVLINPGPEQEYNASPNIIFSGYNFDKKILDKQGTQGRFCVVIPEKARNVRDLKSDFEIVDNGSTTDIFGVKFILKDLGSGEYKLIIEMADLTFCYIKSKEAVKSETQKLDHPVDVLLLPLGKTGMDISDAVQTSVAIKPDVVSAFSFNGIEESKIRSFKAEIEDRNIEMYNF